MTAAPLPAETPAAAPAAGRPAAPTTVAAVPRAARVKDRGIVRHDTLRADQWRADGTVKVLHDVDVGSAHLTGSLSVGGGLSADAFRLRGALEVEGVVRVRSTGSVRGTFRAAGEVRAGDLTLDGVGRTGGTITVDRTLTVQGTLDAPSVTAGLLEIDGVVRIPGEVRALGVRAELGRRSTLGTVVARRVRLSGHVPNLVDKAFFREDRVFVGRVEADSVELEGVDVGFVRGKEIALGRNCHVTAVEGAVVRRHASSTVGPESKSPPPYGLRR